MMRGGSPACHATSAANTDGPSRISLLPGVPTGSRNAPVSSLVACLPSCVATMPAIGRPAPSMIHPAIGSSAGEDRASGAAVTTGTSGVGAGATTLITGLTSTGALSAPASSNPSGTMAATMTQRGTAMRIRAIEVQQVAGAVPCAAPAFWGLAVLARAAKCRNGTPQES
jgi:hypothetical protein